MAYVELIDRTGPGRFRVLGRQAVFEVERNTPVLALKLAKVLRDRLGFDTKKPVSGLDETLVECTRGPMKLLLAWDSTSGLSVMGQDQGHARCPEDLRADLEGLLAHEVFAGYIRRLG